MKTIILMCCLGLLSCTQSQREQIAPTPSQEAQHISYLLDSRTNLCFAVSYVSEYPVGTATIFANVPCTPEVIRLIK